MKIKPIKISSKIIGLNKPVFIIAEAGVNHNGSLHLAKKLVSEAKRAGADCVKFQTFKAERVVALNAPKAAYQLTVTPKKESQYEMLKKLELSESGHRKLADYCKKQKIIFLSTPYSNEDADFLSELGVPAFKIASGQIIELPFLRHLSKKAKPILLSTGMSTMREVEQAVKTIMDAGNNKIILLQCTTNYPSRIEDANLSAMAVMREKFKLNAGYSDHTIGSAAAVASVALGACVIEKHFTINKKLPGPDHSSSAVPAEFAAMVKDIRQAEKALGNGRKKPSRTEARNIKGMRRSIAAKLPIKSGSVITHEMLCFKRPATGLTPALADKLAGARARRDIPRDCFISWKDIKVKL